MTLRVLPCSLAALVYLAERARADEIAEYEALRGLAWDAEEVACEAWSRVGEKFMAVTELGEPVLAGGFEPVCRGVFRGWMLGTDASWAAHGIAFTRIVRKLVESVFASGAHRVEVTTLATRVAACRWYLHGLKMRFEGAHRGRGANGEDAVTYARTGEAR